MKFKLQNILFDWNWLRVFCSNWLTDSEMLSQMHSKAFQLRNSEISATYEKNGFPVFTQRWAAWNERKEGKMALLISRI